MAMLAEPRRKQKVINLRAKNNAWSNDSTKFGQRMLEKMGWSTGKGLGASENGIVEHVVAKYKNDDKGLGFEDRSDQWTKHEDDFNSLLANLSNGKQEGKLHSGISLEVKSKKSKARVHYHKFTRGKDLTRYSEKDLANIFGKKTLKREEKEPEIFKADDLKTTEVVFTEKGSMEDYFKSKIAALKGKNKVSFSNTCDNNEDTDYSFKGFAGTGSGKPESPDQCDAVFQGFSFYDKNNDNTPNVPTEASEEPVRKKSKKNKKSKQDYKEAQNSCQNKTSGDDLEAPREDSDQTELIKNKKCKRNKHRIEETPEELPKKKKSKNNKNIEDNQIIEEQVKEVTNIPKKKKKRKNKDN